MTRTLLAFALLVLSAGVAAQVPPPPPPPTNPTPAQQPGTPPAQPPAGQRGGGRGRGAVQVMTLDDGRVARRRADSREVHAGG